MVDFNNEATVGTPAVDIERISILRRRYDFIEAWEDYKKQSYQGVSAGLNVVRARLFSLFLELQAMIKRRKSNDYNKIVETIKNKSSTETDILDIFVLINEELDAIKLTKIDTQRVYDSSNVEEENEIKGF